jgi:hypothetical protein
VIRTTGRGWLCQHRVGVTFHGTHGTRGTSGVDRSTRLRYDASAGLFPAPCELHSGLILYGCAGTGDPQLG